MIIKPVIYAITVSSSKQLILYVSDFDECANVTNANFFCPSVNNVNCVNQNFSSVPLCECKNPTYQTQVAPNRCEGEYESCLFI